MKIAHKQTIKPALKNKIKLIGKIRFANFIKSQENEFINKIRETENNPIFRKLKGLGSSYPSVIKTVKPSNFGYSCRWSRYIDEISKDKRSVDVEQIIENHKDASDKIKSVGVNKFERYFLSRELGLSKEMVAKQCEITLSDVGKIDSLLDDIALHEQFSEYSDNVENTAVYYTKIAVIEKCTKDFLIRFSSLCYLRGRYEIDYSVIETLKKRCIFNKMELRELNVLLRDMEFINARKSVIYRILHSILDKQKDYFISGDPLSLVPYTQKEIAQQLKIDNSIVSRAIYSKSIVTPFAQEKPLDFFLPSTKDVYKLKVQMIIKDNPGVSDTKIGAILNTKYNISISRRSISVYRKNLGIKTYYKRSYK